MNQGVKVYAVHLAASNKNPLVGCCEQGNELFFLVQNKTLMKFCVALKAGNVLMTCLNVGC